MDEALPSIKDIIALQGDTQMRDLEAKISEIKGADLLAMERTPYLRPWALMRP